MNDTLKHKTLSCTLIKSVLIAFLWLASTHGNISQAQSITQILKGTWEVESWYCNNFLDSEDSRCSNDPKSGVGKTYEFAFSSTGDGKIKLGDYYYPFEMIIDKGKLTLAINMKMFVLKWYVVEIGDRYMKVSFFDSDISFEDGSQSFTGDFNYLTLIKQ